MEHNAELREREVRRNSGAANSRKNQRKRTFKYLTKEEEDSGSVSYNLVEYVMCMTCVCVCVCVVGGATRSGGSS